MKSGNQFGLPDIDVPPVDFSRISNRIQAVINKIQKHDSEERFCGLGAKVMFGEARFHDEHTIQLDGKHYTAKNWVIATGSSPVAPPISGLHETGFLTNREIFSLERLPESLTILGGGPIGIEMAQAFNRLGSRVTIVDRADQILGKEDKDMADAVMGMLVAEGVDFHLGARIERVEAVGGQKTVILPTVAGERKTLASEDILVAMGRAANVDGLNLESIGVDFKPSGVFVDSRLRTSQKHIYAAGDVSGGFQFTHAAGYEGGVVVSNAVFHLPRKTDYTFLPWCTYTDPELASIGMNETRAREAGLEYAVWTEAFQDNDRSLAEGGLVGKVKMILDKKEKPLGVQILGLRAGDLIAEWVAALNGKVKLSTLAAAVHPYPTLGEINKRVVGSYFSPKIFSDKVQKGLKFFFNLKGRACYLEEE
jgi:pyruvate/2-oxoglutarate dehydrogenase complex dihydrolipoamide dehydrogenase (E3) component